MFLFTFLYYISGRLDVQQFYLKADFISVSAGWVCYCGKKI